jgi:Na+/proline symporter
MPANINSRLKNISRELILFIIISFAVGMAGSLVESTLNNFLNDSFSLTGFQRSFLEFPRELPGFLVVFVSALFWFLGSRRLGAFAMLLGNRDISRWFYLLDLHTYGGLFVHLQHGSAYIHASGVHDRDGIGC